MENKSSIRTEVGKIIVQEANGSIQFRIKDSYGEDAIDKELLDLILHEKVL